MRKTRAGHILTLASLVLVAGCAGWVRNKPAGDAHRDFIAASTQIEYPTVQVPPSEPIAGGPPRTFRDTEVEYRDLPLEEAMHLALTHTSVLRDLGATLIRAPESLATPHDPAIQETDPLFGVPAALSAFDAQLAMSLLAEKNDRRVNNQFLGELGFYDQDLDTFSAGIFKRAATGSQFAVRHRTEFDRDNSLANLFPGGGWTTIYEAEARQPLLRGAGLTFNRIAGPDGAPGNINGVVIARIRTDITLAEFEIQLRNFLSNVENAYWDLYFAYRDLDAKIRARDAALDTWRRIHALFLAQRRGGEAAREAQAREQLFRFEEEVQTALVGRLLDRTSTFNGSSPGTFQGLPGVHVAERRLRLILGLPTNGTDLLRPCDEPAAAPTTFDWSLASNEALVNRAELRQQRWQVKRREMELVASKNFPLPELDAVARYRWRGFGDDLIDPGDRTPRFDNAYADLTSGKFQEWQLGLEMNMPIGFRRENVAVRNAQWLLARERALLVEQERQVIHDLSGAVAEAARAFAVVQIGYNRVQAAEVEVRAMADAYDRGEVDLFVLLDAQRRLAEGESSYFRSRVEYALALRNVEFEKGTLLEYCGVRLAEGPWPLKAYADAAERERNRGNPVVPYSAPNDPPIVSGGIVPQTSRQ